MINVQRFVARRAFALIDALMAELLEQIFSLLETGQFALLIFAAVNFSVLHHLQIEFDPFHCQAFDRIDAHQPARDRRNVFNTTFKRRRRPTFGASAIVEARRAITGLSTAASTTLGATRIKTFLDRVPAMNDFSGEDDFASLLVDDGEAGGL